MFEHGELCVRGLIVLVLGYYKHFVFGSLHCFIFDVSMVEFFGGTFPPDDAAPLPPLLNTPSSVTFFSSALPSFLVSSWTPLAGLLVVNLFDHFLGLLANFRLHLFNFFCDFVRLLAYFLINLLDLLFISLVGFFVSLDSCGQASWHLCSKNLIWFGNLRRDLEQQHLPQMAHQRRIPSQRPSEESRLSVAPFHYLMLAWECRIEIVKGDGSCKHRRFPLGKGTREG
jgi:hypothetical protein